MAGSENLITLILLVNEGEHLVLVLLSKANLEQELLQNEKAHIDCEKGAQISILADKIAIQ